MFRDRLKRLFDLACSVPLSAVALPLIGLCGALVKAESAGPMLFRQTRVGRYGRDFTVLKIRTMVDGAESMGAGLYTAEQDPRFTRMGLLLRRLSLDELPQVLNVLKGDMSLVGPRPLPRVVVEEYPEEFETILRVKPGLTGLSQVSGRNRLTRREALTLDQRYARSWSFWLDVKILARTVTVVLTGSGQENYRSRNDVER